MFLLAAALVTLLAACARPAAPAVPAAPRPLPSATTAPTALAVPTVLPIPAASPTSRPSPTLSSSPTAAARPAQASATPVKRILDMPIYRQQHALSCEAAALRMALAALGSQVGEEALLAQLARDPTPRRVLPDGSLQWGDPDVGFVGHWDGVFLQDGYGVYEGPIADLAVARGFLGTTRARGVEPRELYAAIRQGFPVIVWIPYGLEVRGRGTWSTPAGQRIEYVVTEHAVVLARVEERGVYYADPMKADLQYAPFAAFERGLSELGRRAVIPRP